MAIFKNNGTDSWLQITRLARQMEGKSITFFKKGARAQFLGSNLRKVFTTLVVNSVLYLKL